MIQNPINRFLDSTLSNLKTLVLLFSFLNSMTSSMAYANGFVSQSTNDQCSYFYRKSIKKSPVQAPEFLPVAGIWDKPKHYDPSPTNKFFNNRETRNLDQRYSRECFLFAYLGALETTHLNRQYNSRRVQFSAAYLVARKFEHVISEIISNNQNGQGMYFKLDGGETYHAMKLTELYGLVPEDVWSPLVPLDSWNFQKIYDEIIEKTNVIINNRNQNPNFYNSADYSAMAQQIFTEVMSQYVGEWPKPFWYDGIYHTPQSFSSLYGFDRKGDVEIKYLYSNGPYLDGAQTYNLPFYINPLLHRTMFNTHHRPDTTQSLFKAVKEALALDRAVLLDVDGFDPVVGHQFVITDLEILPNGNIKAVKLKNSYTNWGSAGYAWYSADAIAKVLRRVWILDVNSNIPSPKLNPSPKN